MPRALLSITIVLIATLVSSPQLPAATGRGTESVRLLSITSGPRLIVFKIEVCARRATQLTVEAYLASEIYTGRPRFPFRTTHQPAGCREWKLLIRNVFLPGFWLLRAKVALGTGWIGDTGWREFYNRTQ